MKYFKILIITCHHGEDYTTRWDKNWKSIGNALNNMKKQTSNVPLMLDVNYKKN